MNCPNCGFPVFDGGWQKREYRKFSFGSEAAFLERDNGFSIPVGVEWEKKMPAREANMQSDVFVPLVQSLVTGLCAGVGCGAIWDIPVGFAVGAATMGVSWLILMGEHRRLLWIVEKIKNVDLDNDGAIGEPTTTRIEVDITDGNQKQTIFLGLGIPQDKIVIFAKGILAGKSTSEGTWVGSGKLFSPAEYNELRGELIDRKLAEWRNKDTPQQGWKLRLAGIAVFRKLAS